LYIGVSTYLTAKQKGFIIQGMVKISLEKMEATMKDKLYTVTELADLFQVSRQSVHNWIADGRFPGAFTVGEGGGKMTLVPASGVEKVKEEEAAKLIKQLDRLGFQTSPA
jgi:predicted DNA-binding transcriptional regulator AlpA